MNCNFNYIHSYRYSKIIEICINQVIQHFQSMVIGVIKDELKKCPYHERIHSQLRRFRQYHKI